MVEEHAAPMVTHNQDGLLMHNKGGVLLSKV